MEKPNFRTCDFFSIERNGQIFTAKTTILPKSCHITLLRYNATIVKQIEEYFKIKLKFPPLRQKSNCIEVIGKWENVETVLSLFFDILSIAPAVTVCTNMNSPKTIPESWIKKCIEAHQKSMNEKNWEYESYVESISGFHLSLLNSYEDVSDRYFFDDNDGYDENEEDDDDDDNNDELDTEDDTNGNLEDEEKEDCDSEISGKSDREDNLHITKKSNVTIKESDLDLGIDLSNLESRIQLLFEDWFKLHEKSKEFAAFYDLIFLSKEPMELAKSCKQESNKEVIKNCNKEPVETCKIKDPVKKVDEKDQKKIVDKKQSLKNVNKQQLSKGVEKLNTGSNERKNLKKLNEEAKLISGEPHSADPFKKPFKKRLIESSEDVDGGNKKKKRQRKRTVSSTTQDETGKNSEPSVNINSLGELNKKAERKSEAPDKETAINDSFLQLLRDTAESCPKKENPQLYVKAGSEELINCHYMKAIGNLKKAKEMLKCTLEPTCTPDIDSILLTYTLCTASIKSGTYENIVFAIKELNGICEALVYRLPAIKYLTAFACHKLNRFKVAENILDELFCILEKGIIVETFKYPGTGVVIPETQVEHLKSVSKELESNCRLTQFNAIAVCRYEKCTDLSSHIYPSKYMYITDPDFAGYIAVTCHEKCDVEYHISCWKAYKDSKISVPGKVSDKDFLGQPCPTMDCKRSDNSFSPIIKIDIYDVNGALKHRTNIDPAKIKIVKKKKPEKSDKVEKTDKAEKMDKVEKTDKTKAEKPLEKLAPPKKAPPDEPPKIKIKTPFKKVSEKPVFRPFIPNLKLDFTANNLQKKKDDIERIKKISLNRLKALRQSWASYCFVDPALIQLSDESECYIEMNDEDGPLKSFIRSMIKELLLAEGFQKVNDIEEKWTKGEEFVDVKSSLKSPKNICDILLESSEFYILEDFLCLGTQLPDVYCELKTVALETLEYMYPALFASKTDKPVAEEASNNTDTFRFLPLLEDNYSINNTERGFSPQSPLDSNMNRNDLNSIIPPENSSLSSFTSSEMSMNKCETMSLKEHQKNHFPPLSTMDSHNENKKSINKSTNEGFQNNNVSDVIVECKKPEENNYLDKLTSSLIQSVAKIYDDVKSEYNDGHEVLRSNLDAECSISKEMTVEMIDKIFVQLYDDYDELLRNYCASCDKSYFLSTNYDYIENVRLRLDYIDKDLSQISIKDSSYYVMKQTVKELIQDFKNTFIQSEIINNSLDSCETFDNNVENRKFFLSEKTTTEITENEMKPSGNYEIKSPFNNLESDEPKIKSKNIILPIENESKLSENFAIEPARSNLESNDSKTVESNFIIPIEDNERIESNLVHSSDISNQISVPDEYESEQNLSNAYDSTETNQTIYSSLVSMVNKALLNKILRSTTVVNVENVNEKIDESSNLSNNSNSNPSNKKKNLSEEFGIDKSPISDFKPISEVSTVNLDDGSSKVTSKICETEKNDSDNAVISKQNLQSNHDLPDSTSSNHTYPELSESDHGKNTSADDKEVKQPLEQMKIMCPSNENKKQDFSENYSCSSPNMNCMQIFEKFNVSAVLSEIEVILTFIRDYNETNEINYKVLSQLVDNFLFKFCNDELLQISTKTKDEKIILKCKVKLCLNFIKKFGEFYINNINQTLNTVRSFGFEFIERCNSSIKNSDLDVFSSKISSPVSQKSLKLEACWELESEKCDVSKKVVQTTESSTQTFIGCRDASFQTCFNSKDFCVQTEIEESNQANHIETLISHISSQNNSIIEFCCDKKFPTEVITEDLASVKDMIENCGSDTTLQSRLTTEMNSKLVSNILKSFEDNFKNYKLTTQNILANLRQSQVNNLFKLLRTRYMEKITELEGFLKKFCTNASKNLSCWTQMHACIEQYRKMYHQLNYKEKVFEIKFKKVFAKLDQNELVSTDDIEELLQCEVDEEPEFNLKIGTIEEIFITLLKAAAVEFQRQNQQVLLKTISTLQGGANRDAISSIIAQQQSINQVSANKQSNSVPESTRSESDQVAEKKGGEGNSGSQISLSAIDILAQGDHKKIPVKISEASMQVNCKTKTFDSNSNVDSNIDVKQKTQSNSDNESDLKPDIVNSAATHSVSSENLSISGNCVTKNGRDNFNDSKKLGSNSTQIVTEKKCDDSFTKKCSGSKVSEPAVKLEVEIITSEVLGNTAFSSSEEETILEPNPPSNSSQKTNIKDHLDESHICFRVPRSENKKTVNKSIIQEQSTPNVKDQSTITKNVPRNENNEAHGSSATKDVIKSFPVSKEENNQNNVFSSIVETPSKKKRPETSSVKQSTELGSTASVKTKAKTKLQTDLSKEFSESLSKPSQTEKVKNPQTPVAVFTTASTPTNYYNPSVCSAEPHKPTYCPTEPAYTSTGPANVAFFPVSFPNHPPGFPLQAIPHPSYYPVPYPSLPSNIPPQTMLTSSFPPTSISYPIMPSNIPPQSTLMQPPISVFPSKPAPNNALPLRMPRCSNFSSQQPSVPSSKSTNPTSVSQITSSSKKKPSIESDGPPIKASKDMTKINSTKPNNFLKPLLVPTNNTKTKSTPSEPEKLMSKNNVAKTSQQKSVEPKGSKTADMPKATKSESLFLPAVKFSSFKKLFMKMQCRFPDKTEVELILYIKRIREMNRSSLSGLSYDEILVMIDSILDQPVSVLASSAKGASKTVSVKSSAAPVTMGLEKFGESAWVKCKEADNSKYSNENLVECVICCTRMSKNTTTTLQCKHIFHTHCLRDWLKIKCVCPLCQTFCKMPDEYPSLR